MSESVMVMSSPVLLLSLREVKRACMMLICSSLLDFGIYLMFSSFHLSGIMLFSCTRW